MRACVFFCSVFACVSCAAPPDEKPEDNEPERFTRDHTALDIQVRTDLPFSDDGPTMTFSGVVRAAADADLALRDEAGDGGEIDLATAFAVDAEVAGGEAGEGGEAGAILISIHHVLADSSRELVYQPAPGTTLRGTLRLASFFGSYSAIFHDDDGVAFWGSELFDGGLAETPADLDVEDDPAGERLSTECGHVRETQLVFTCGDPHVLTVGESASFCGLQFTNHSSARVEEDWACTDSANPTIWSAVRP